MGSWSRSRTPCASTTSSATPKICADAVGNPPRPHPILRCELDTAWEILLDALALEAADVDLYRVPMSLILKMKRRIAPLLGGHCGARTTDDDRQRS